MPCRVARFQAPDLDVRAQLAEAGEPDVTVNYVGRTAEPTANGALLQPAPESPGPEETETGLREHVHGIDVMVTGDRLGVVWYYSTNQFDRETVEGYAAELVARVERGLGGNAS